MHGNSCWIVGVVWWYMYQIIHSPSIALAGSTTSKLCKTPKKNNPTSSLPAATRNIIFHRRGDEKKKSRNKRANKMTKARSDDPVKLQSDHGWCASPNAHTGAKGFFWHTRFTYSLNAWHNLWLIYVWYTASPWRQCAQTIPLLRMTASAPLCANDTYECEPDSLCCCW